MTDPWGMRRRCSVRCAPPARPTSWVRRSSTSRCSARPGYRWCRAAAGRPRAGARAPPSWSSWLSAGARPRRTRTTCPSPSSGSPTTRWVRSPRRRLRSATPHRARELPTATLTVSVRQRPPLRPPLRPARPRPPRPGPRRPAHHRRSPRRRPPPTPTPTAAPPPTATPTTTPSAPGPSDPDTTGGHATGGRVGQHLQLDPQGGDGRVGVVRRHGLNGRRHPDAQGQGQAAVPRDSTAGRRSALAGATHRVR